MADAGFVALRNDFPTQPGLPVGNPAPPARGSVPVAVRPPRPAQLEIEGQRTTLNEATLQVLPPLCVHGFRFAEDVEGYVLTLAAPLVSHLQAQLGATVDGLQVLGSYPAGKDSDYLNNLFARLQDEYADEQPARDMLMHALVSVLLVWISRQAIQRRHPRAPRGREYFRRFTQLVEQHYREHPKIEDPPTSWVSRSHT